MIDREKVITGLECCRSLTGEACRQCPYDEECAKKIGSGYAHLWSDVQELLKEQQETIASLQGTIYKLNAALAEQPAKDTNVPSKWVDVNKKLPEVRHAVLCYSPFYKNMWALTLHEDGDWYYWIPKHEKYAPEFEGPITHWMPLPEPPEEVTQDA